MSLVALANALLDEPMPRRFHAEPMIRAPSCSSRSAMPTRRADHRAFGGRAAFDLGDQQDGATASVP